MFFNNLSLLRSKHCRQYIYLKNSLATMSLTVSHFIASKILMNNYSNKICTEKVLSAF